MLNRRQKTIDAQLHHLLRDMTDVRIAVRILIENQKLDTRTQEALLKRIERLEDKRDDAL